MNQKRFQGLQPSLLTHIWEAFSFFRISYYGIDISSALNFSFSLRFFFWSIYMCVYICVWMLMERRKGSQVYESQAFMSYSTCVLESGNLIPMIGQQALVNAEPSLQYHFLYALIQRQTRWEAKLKEVGMRATGYWCDYFRIKIISISLNISPPPLSPLSLSLNLDTRSTTSQRSIITLVLLPQLVQCYNNNKCDLYIQFISHWERNLEPQAGYIVSTEVYG